MPYNTLVKSEFETLQVCELDEMNSIPRPQLENDDRTFSLLDVTLRCVFSAFIAGESFSS